MDYNVKRLIYPLELIRTGMLFLDVVRWGPIGGFYPYNPIRSMILYTFERVDGGILPINREYKPLGVSFYSPCASYKEYNFLVIPNEYIDFSVLGGKNYLFNDGSFPGEAKTKERYRNIINKFFKGIFNDDFEGRADQLNKWKYTT